MNKFFILKSIDSNDAYKVTKSDYPSNIFDTIISGSSIINLDLENIIVEFNKKGKILPDYMFSQTGLPIISEKFKEIITKELDNELELIELVKIKTNFDHKVSYYIINILNNIKCLDTNKSNIKYYNGTSVIEKADNIELNTIAINQRNIFRVSELNTFYVISDLFRGVIQKSGLSCIKTIPLSEYVKGF